MTNEEAIKILERYEPIEWGNDQDAFDMAKEALSADTKRRADCSNFLLWLLDEIMDEENWELNAVADGEIIARKLKKLGLLEVKDGYYHCIFDENVWVGCGADCASGVVQDEDAELPCEMVPGVPGE